MDFNAYCYELYNVALAHCCSIYAGQRNVLSGVFCCLLLKTEIDEKISEIFGLLGKTDILWCLVGGKGENHLNPPRKGGEKMDDIPRNNSDRCRFDAYCKTVLRNEALNYLRDMKRQREREIPISALSQTELNQLVATDYHPSDCSTFTVQGYDLHINNEFLAQAFAELPVTEQGILILHIAFDMSDREIAGFMGMSRSAVQRHRTQSLNELREKLKAIMPKGGNW